MEIVEENWKMEECKTTEDKFISSLTLIVDIAQDYDGYDSEKKLKELIDELSEIASYTKKVLIKRKEKEEVEEMTACIHCDASHSSETAAKKCCNTKYKKWLNVGMPGEYKDFPYIVNVD